MGLESTTTIGGLVSTNPVASDALGQADDHIRLLKTVLKTIFPGAGGSGFTTPITTSEAELNYVDGVTSAIQTQLNTHTSDIATAQSTADTGVSNAATADGKAVAAQGTANTALANAATADGKAVDAQADATQALADAATADAKAVAAQSMGAAAWGLFTNGTPPVISKAYNIASIAKNSTGKYTITFTNAMPNVHYVILCRGATYHVIDNNKLTTSFDLEAYTDFTTVTVANPSSIHFVIYAAA
jgi:hypothetical protein